MATPDALYKYVPYEEGHRILETGNLRWRSPALLDDPWFIGHEPVLGFDPETVNKAMLNTAVSMLFTRDIPPGNMEHPLYKAICRWRTEDRFKDETEAWDALSELLAPTPGALQEKLQRIVSNWRDLVEHARTICFFETVKDSLCWHHHADRFRGLVLRFDTEDTLAEPKPVEYTQQRPHLTTVREQVNDLVGIERANVEHKFESKLLARPKQFAAEREWRCIRILEEEDLDCGEDVEDWYMDERFLTQSLKAVYLGFRMPEDQIKTIFRLIGKHYPGATVYRSSPADEQFELEFEKLSSANFT